jgi:hypothetical protein
MNMTRLLSVVGVFIIVAIVTAIVQSGATAADEPTFGKPSAVANISALSAQPLFAPPSELSRLGEGIQPSRGEVRALGTAGYAWTRADASVCVLMSNQTGGCFSKFEKPVLLFVTATSAPNGEFIGPQQVTGVVPDQVTGIVLVTDTGERIQPSIAANAFDAQIPAGAAIAGEQVTLADGRTFFAEDSVKLIPGKIQKDLPR